MKKGQEYIVRKLDDMYIVRFTYYFKTKEECANYISLYIYYFLILYNNNLKLLINNR